MSAPEAMRPVVRRIVDDLRDEDEEGVEIHGYRGCAVQLLMDVIREATAAGAKDEHIAEIGSILKNALDLLERGAVLFIAPRPVAVDVPVVGIEALVDR